MRILADLAYGTMEKQMKKNQKICSNIVIVNKNIPPLANALHGVSQMVVCGGTIPIIELW